MHSVHAHAFKHQTTSNAAAAPMAIQTLVIAAIKIGQAVRGRAGRGGGRHSQATEVWRTFCGGLRGVHAGSRLCRTVMIVLMILTPTKEATMPTASSLVPFTASAPNRCPVVNV